LTQACMKPGLSWGDSLGVVLKTVLSERANGAKHLVCLCGQGIVKQQSVG
jgi:hypothetical protein